uniref:Uncharacterized protein n=1 Tax=Escherichia coli TaxID=562 RepID=A0A2R4KLF7_ECOLX|nr:Hypothetical protein [Escherichia coli]
MTEHENPGRPPFFAQSHAALPLTLDGMVCDGTSPLHG